MKITSDSLNPVLIKDYRQHFHSKLLPIVMTILLGGQLLAILITQLALDDNNNRPNDDTGLFLFHIILGIFCIAAWILCALQPMQRFIQERANPELDFTRMCSMTPRQIISGKLSSSLLIVLYLVSLCLPFMVIAYFLKGISILDIATVFASVLAIGILMIQIAILVGSTGKKSLAFIFFFSSIYLTPIVISIDVAIFSKGIGKIGFLDVIRVASAYLFVMVFLYVLNIAILGTKYTNNILPTRCFLIVCAALATLEKALSYFLKKDFLIPHSTLSIEAILCFIAAIIATIAAWERHDSGPRVLNEAPKKLIPRSLFFLISSGSASGIALAWIIAIIPIIRYACETIGKVNALPSGLSPVIFIINGSIFIIAYAQFAIILSKFIPSKPPVLSWLISIVVLALVPAVFAGIFDITDRSDLSKFILALTPFQESPEIIIALIFAAVGAIPCAFIVAQKARDFLKQ